MLLIRVVSARFLVYAFDHLLFLYALCRTLGRREGGRWGGVVVVVGWADGADGSDGWVGG